MLEQSCKPILIASSNACEIWACEDWGMIHFHIGSVSMRLKQEHFMKTVETFSEASRHLNPVYSDTNRSRHKYR